MIKIEPTILEQLLNKQFISNNIENLENYLYKNPTNILELLKNHDFYLLKKKYMKLYSLLAYIRPFIDKNKSTHTCEIFSQVSSNIVGLMESLNSFFTEYKNYDSTFEYEITSEKIKNSKLLNDIKQSDPQLYDSYNLILENHFKKEVGEQNQNYIEASLQNIINSFYELLGLITSNSTQIYDFIDYKSNSH
jgi:flagellar basal body-associated protein FliL